MIKRITKQIEIPIDLVSYIIEQLGDIGGGGDGPSQQYIDGEVEYHQNLPTGIGNPTTNTAYLVKKGQGVWLINRKPAGIWVRETDNGNLNDWVYAGSFPDVYNDANFRIYDNDDSSKNLAFNLDNLNSNTTVTLTIPPSGGTVITSNDTGVFYPLNNPSGFITSGNFYPNNNPSGFITGVDTSSFYPSSNPSGFITGIAGLDLSSYVTGSVVRPGEISKIIDKFTASSNQPPAAGFATLDTRSSILVLDYDDTVTESGTFIGMIPETAGIITGLRVRIMWSATTATNENCRWGARFADLTSSGINAPFDLETEVNSTANSINGRVTTTDILCSGTAGLMANEFYRLLVYRNSADTVNDTMAGDAELISVTTYLA